MGLFSSTRLILRVFMLFFIWYFKGQAQTNQVINYPTLGISFEVPNQWIGQDVKNGFLLNNQEVPGFILLTTHDLKNMQAIQQEMEQGFTLAPNSKLRAASTLTPIGAHAMGGNFTGTIPKPTL